MAITNLYISANRVGPSWFGHLQIVGKDENGSFFELEVQAGVAWVVLGDGTRVHDNITNTPYYNDPLNYTIVELDLGSRDANDVWDLLINISDSIDDYALTYTLSNNSNTYAHTMLNVVGIDVFDYVAQLTSENITSFPGLNADDGAHVTHQELAFYVNGTNANDTIIGGIWGDTIVGGEGRDSLIGGLGHDTLSGGLDKPGNTMAPPRNDLVSDRLEGGEGDDNYLISGTYSDYTRDSSSVYYSIEHYYRESAWYVLSLKYIDTIYDSDGVGEISAYFELGTDEAYSQTVSFDVYHSFVHIPSDERSNFRYDAYEVLGPNTGSWQIDTDAVTGVVEITARNSEGAWAQYAILQAGYGSTSPSTHNPFVAIELGTPPQLRFTESGELFFIGSGQDDLQGGGTADDQIYGEGGDDVLSGGEGSDYIEGGEGDDNLFGDEDGDVLLGGNGSDILQGGNGNDILVGEGGADEIHGGEGDDFIFIDADDTAFTGGDGYDRLVFQGTGAFVFELTNSGFEELYSGDGNDLLTGSQGDDVIKGGTGHDFIQGGSGNDIYIYASGDGNDSIEDATNETDEIDTLSLLDLDLVDIAAFRVGEDLKITVVETGDVITIEDQFLGSNSHWGLESIEFADGYWDRATIMSIQLQSFTATSNWDTLWGNQGNDYFVGGLGDDSLFGGAGSDAYAYSVGDGDDYIDDEADEADQIDRIVFTDLNSQDVFVYREDIHLKIRILETGQTITVDEQWYDVAQYWGMEKIVFADGTSWDRSKIMATTVDGVGGIEIVGTSNDDTLTNSDANEVIKGGIGDDIYTYMRGDGNDILIEGLLDGGNDQLLLSNLSLNDIALGRERDDLVVTVWESSAAENDGGTILIKDTLGNHGDRGVESFTVFEGTFSKSDIKAFLLNQAVTSSGDVIEGFGGSGDYLLGGAGNDTFVFRSGFGWDAIGDFDAGVGTDDVIEFRDWIFEDFESVLVSAFQDGSDTMINIDATNSVRLENVSLSNLHADDFRFVA